MNCNIISNQSIIFKWSKVEMNRTVFKFFFPDINIPAYPQTKFIKKEELAEFVNHNLLKQSKTSKKSNKPIKQIQLSLKDIKLTLSTMLFKLSFHPIFKDPDSDVWFPLF